MIPLHRPLEESVKKRFCQVLHLRFTLHLHHCCCASWFWERLVDRLLFCIWLRSTGLCAFPFRLRSTFSRSPHLAGSLDGKACNIGFLVRLFPTSTGCILRRDFFSAFWGLCLFCNCCMAWRNCLSFQFMLSMIFMISLMVWQMNVIWGWRVYLIVGRNELWFHEGLAMSLSPRAWASSFMNLGNDRGAL